MDRMGRHLVYTLALDMGGATAHRNMAKLLVSSLLRTRFDGDIVVFHNSPHPLFMVPRKGVREVALQSRRKYLKTPVSVRETEWGLGSDYASLSLVVRRGWALLPGHRSSGLAVWA